ncbi:N-acetylmuramoyl-L-alanine amidase [Biostraticola tofi]|uniref:N-acetylmuramoyl-L-alanine amidase n=1 Tax=Biostraticola tofi TaxID=466109 RepID=A0A4R3Z1M0_9GAMM|nr:N-acetylmuramoyl-L-alanine amidase [Biostraticola tofi]
MNVRGIGLALLFTALLAGCQSGGVNIRDADKPGGSDERIQFLVIHYTAGDFDSSLATLSNNVVSAHYLVPSAENNDTVIRLVDESRRAWHAGASYWRGRTHLNDTSIGIEAVNGGYRRTAKGIVWSRWPPGQIELVINLSRQIIERYRIEPANVVGHSDIAWRRKQDPGPLFPWRQLAEAGIGLWPQQARVEHYLKNRPADAPVGMDGIIKRLSRYGYDVTPDMPTALQRKAISAFQMHFRQRDFRGLPDAETEAILDSLLEINAGDRSAG